MSNGKRGMNASWSREKRQKEATGPPKVSVGSIVPVPPNQSFTIQGIAMDKSPEKANKFGRYEIVTVMEKNDVIPLFLAEKVIPLSKDIIVGRMYEFLLYSVTVRKSYSEMEGSKENYFGQSLRVNEMKIRLLDKIPVLEIKSLAVDPDDEPSFSEPVKFLMVKACIEIVECELKILSRCSGCQNKLMEGPKKSDGQKDYHCGMCKKKFKGAASVDWEFKYLTVIIKDGETEARVLLGNDVIRTLLGQEAKYYCDKDDMPVLETGPECFKWLLKMLYGRYMEDDKITYFVCNVTLGNILDDEQVEGHIEVGDIAVDVKQQDIGGGEEISQDFEYT